MSIAAGATDAPGVVTLTAVFCRPRKPLPGTLSMGARAPAADQARRVDQTRLMR